MPDDWAQTTIGKQVTLQRGFDITKKTQRPGNVPVVSTSGIQSFHDQSMVEGPGVVIGRKGNGIGRAHYVASEFWPHDTTLWVKDFHGNHPLFVYYFFLRMFPTLNSMDVGSANPTLNRNHVHTLPIAWPPLEQQRRISEKLRTLDDKIELNGRMNGILEGMARAIFKAWFVDFEPVQAKAAGATRFPGMPQSVFDQLPNRLVDSELGQIPEGWEVVPLSDMFVLSRSTRR